MKRRDPAARSRWDVLFYPGVWAIGFHRVAHTLWASDFHSSARLVNHFARFLTGNDIHPGATIGKNFFIDHGFCVIGETAQIGNDVTIYQHVTLGGTNPSDGIGGKRHPTVHDRAVIGSGAQVIGPIEVGKGAKVGANAVVTKSVPSGATVIGIPARPVPVEVVHQDSDFMPYGTPCDDRSDPYRMQIARLETELTQLRQAISRLHSELTQPSAKSAS